MTMSWGCAHLAVEEAIQAGEGPYAVIGCGALGLSTARLLQKKGLETTIYAKDLPPRTTSNIACASWYPAESSDPNKQTPEWTNQFMRAARLSYRYFQDYVGDRYSIRWLPNYTLSDEPMEDRGLDASDSPIHDLFPERADLGPEEHPFGYRYCRVNWTMMIETLAYLNAVVRDYRLAGGNIVVREFSNQEDVLSLPESVFINCTGIGAKALFEDEELMPIKGQLTVLLPQEEIDYITVAGGLYMMPRKDGILLGGTHERGEWSLEPNQEAIQRVVEGHTEFFQRMA
jgi:glycine/D-amino acid oxidase-like deaminating enzyme